MSALVWREVDHYAVIPLNEYTWHTDPEPGKVAEIAASMRASGWQGAPVVTHDGGAYALTGTHRIAAAREAGIKVRVVDAADLVPNGAEVLAAVQAANEWAGTFDVAVAVLSEALGERYEDLGIDHELVGVYVDGDLLQGSTKKEEK